MDMWPVEWFDEIDSTNEEARRRVTSGHFQNVWIAARSQSAGRGRLGRRWKSPVGNLFATALFHLDGTMMDASKIPFVAAVAVSDVFHAFAPSKPVALKWPNDVRYQGAKLSGILIEAGHLDKGCWVAAGMGLNIQEAPGEIDQSVSCLTELRGDRMVKAEMALNELRQRFAERLHHFSAGFESIRQSWLERAEGLGERITTRRSDVHLEGIFEGLGSNGELLLRLPDGELVVITAGDVELIKERAI